MLSHANIAWLIECLRVLYGRTPAGLRVVEYGPMAHAGERFMSHYQHVHFGTEVTICPDVSRLVEFLPLVRPQAFFAPPRIFEKVQAAALRALGHDGHGVDLEGALAVGREVARHRAVPEPLPEDLAQAWADADAAVLGPLRVAVGLDAAEIITMAAAWLPPDLVDFFRGLGVPVSESYGLTEATGLVAWDPVEVRPGTVGRNVPGTEVRILPDGEIAVRGGNVFVGYLDDPEATATAVDGDGWLHTGDIGSVDAEGYLRILDRKKDLIVTAGGKNIAPALIEARLRSLPLVAHAFAVGDGRRFVTAILSLDHDAVQAWAEREGVPIRSVGDLARHEKLVATIEDGVAGVNAELSRPEQVKRFVVVADEWVPDSDVLTPTMKVKRRGLLARYADEIEGMYAP
jgi:long-chain acyl-CoA synthetase